MKPIPWMYTGPSPLFIPGIHVTENRNFKAGDFYLSDTPIHLGDINLLDVIAELVDTQNPCEFDDDGLCQTHRTSSQPGYCSNADAIKVLTA